MIIESAEFKCSNPGRKGCPETKLPEFAFIGRSNVGKSSLINFITGRRKLAHTSNKPGKTQLINHFLINEKWYLVDLPGYGFAKQSKKMRESWEKMIRDFILFRENLALTFVLIDSRHKPLQGDTEFILWLGRNKIPFAVVFTKTDKIGQNELQANLQAYKALLSEAFEDLPFSILSSTVKESGREEILAVIDDNCLNWKAPD